GLSQNRKHLGLDPDFFPTEQLAPMVPPLALKQEESEGCHRNTYLDKATLSDDGAVQSSERIAGRPKPWMRADALIKYLQGEVLDNPVADEDGIDESKEITAYFHRDPWTTQVLPHIKVQPGTRQVADEEGYFTEVAIRMAPHWQLVAAISTELDAKVVRLGGEGHRAIVTPMEDTPPGWDELEKLRSPQPGHETAYVLTPGLAEATIDSELFSLIPETWKSSLRSCVGDRPLLWGGMSVFQKPKQSGQEHENPKDVAFQPQRAFVPAGTIYRFQPGQLPPHAQAADPPLKLLPQADDNWAKTFKSLNYGILLWGQ
ncbi:MAG: type III-B CRISPR module-associated Cmr3 family protein, partial [Cyanobacteria bacterium P01_A01_bin.17]